jgi:hypothetical protein
MRLLRCDVSDEAAPLLEEFHDYFPPYAIISHRWGKTTEEVSFRDIETGADISAKVGYKKFRHCCQQALKDGLQYVWIDTCCIDKGSSAELSEAINSMYNWYISSKVCYAYLNDVLPVSGTSPEILDTLKDEQSSFRNSAWFTRGWTLQELIAPHNVRFYDQEWGFIGDKDELAELVSDITGISVDVLTNRNVSSSVAQKMSWAAGRETTRIEDRAYSLMGIFGVNMPPLYGEGPRAFIRLQEEIMRKSFDHSLFAWEATVHDYGFIAKSPDHFSRCGNIIPINYNTFVAQMQILNGIPDYTQTNFGTRIQLPLEATRNAFVYRAYLACTRRDHLQNNRAPNHKPLVYIYLRKEPGAGVDLYTRCTDSFFAPVDGPQDANPTIVHNETIYVSPSQMPYVPVNKWMVHFRVDSDDDGPSRDYYYGGKIKTALSRHGVSEFEVGLETNGNTVVVIHIGHFVMDAQNNLPKQQKEVYAFLGFSGARVWTDIRIDQDRNLGSNNDIYPRLYTEFLNDMRASSTSVLRHWEGGVTGRAGRWRVKAGITAERKVHGFPFYEAVVKFSLSRKSRSLFKLSLITEPA